MIRTSPLLVFGILASAAIVCDGQTDRQISISGTVVNAVTDAPVPYAVVSLSNESSTEADGGGRFHFSGLAPGVYDVVALKAGFEGAGINIKPGGQQGRLAIQALESVENYVVKLNPYAAIGGRVVDGDGEGLEDAVVTALQSRVVYTRRQLVEVSSVKTDDRGAYRISNLPPGKFLIQAAGPTFHHPYFGENEPAAAATDTFGPTYFGGGQFADSAQSIVLGPGVEARADIAVQLEPERIIRGRIVNYRPHTMATLRLSSGDTDRGLAAVALDYETGRFQIHGVRDGAYRLLAYQKDDAKNLLYEARPIEVAGRNQENVILNLAPPADLRGVLRSDAAASGRPLSFQMHLTPRDAFVEDLGGARWSGPVKGGAFVIASVPAGKYWVDFESDGQYIASAWAGDRDLLATREVIVAATGAPLIEIVLRGDGGSIEGTIDSPASGQTEALALLVSEACNRPAGSTNVSGGEFVFTDVAPGTYRVYAVEQETEWEYGTPAALCAMARGGVAVTVQAGRASTIHLGGYSKGPK